MRFAPLLALLVLALMPAASAASPASLAFAGPAEPIALDEGPKTVPLNLTLTLEKFSCMEDTSFPVHIRIAGTGAYVSLDTQSPVFRVPADSYLVRPYSGTVTVNATLGPDPAAREGVVDLIASFSSGDAAGCVAAGGFQAASANLTLTTKVGGSDNFTGELSPGNGTASGDNETLGNESDETAPDAPTPATPKPRPGSGSKDYIGDYRPPSESSEKSVPAPGAALVVGALAVALLLRRKA